MKRQDKLELVFASLIAVSVIVSLIFAIAIVSPEQGALQGTQSTDASTSIQTSVSLSTATVVSLTTETAFTTLTFSHTSFVSTFSTQVMTITTEITETLPVSSSMTSTSSPANISTDSQIISQNTSTVASSSTAAAVTSTSSATTTTSTSTSTDTSTGSSTANSVVGTTLALSCSPSEFQLGLSTTCTATVTGSNSPPTGQVSFTSPIAGSFIPQPCILKGSASASCASIFTPRGPTTGYYTLTATYLGDGTHLGSSGSVTLIVPPPEPTIVTCFPNDLAVNATAYCSITVDNTQDFPIPTGTVSLSSNMPGTFDKTSCTLDITGACSVHYSPGTGSGGFTTTITATYNSDLYHASSSGTAQLTVT